MEDPRKPILDPDPKVKERTPPRNAKVQTSFLVPKVTTHLLDGTRDER